MDDPRPMGLTLTRIFDAPRALVWAAWTDPEHLANWWGPVEYPATSIDMDVRTGGRWRNCLHGVHDGRDLWQNGVFIEVTPPERIVMSFVWETHGERGIPDTTTDQRPASAQMPVANTNDTVGPKGLRPWPRSGATPSTRSGAR